MRNELRLFMYSFQKSTTMESFVMTRCGGATLRYEKMGDFASLRVLEECRT